MLPLADKGPNLPLRAHRDLEIFIGICWHGSCPNRDFLPVFGLFSGFKKGYKHKMCPNQVLLGYRGRLAQTIVIAQTSYAQNAFSQDKLAMRIVAGFVSLHV